MNRRSFFKFIGLAGFAIVCPISLPVVAPPKPKDDSLFSIDPVKYNAWKLGQYRASTTLKDGIILSHTETKIDDTGRTYTHPVVTFIPRHLVGV